MSTTQVVTQAPGLAAEEVEQQITIPLERELNGTPGLLIMRSRSTFGLSLITLIFRDGIEDYWARQRILERIEDVTLPSGHIVRVLIRCPRRSAQIYNYTLQSDTQGPAGAVRVPALGGDTGAQAGARSCRRHDLGRHHDPVPAWNSIPSS